MCFPHFHRRSSIHLAQYSCALIFSPLCNSSSSSGITAVYRQHNFPCLKLSTACSCLLCSSQERGVLSSNKGNQVDLKQPCRGPSLYAPIPSQCKLNSMQYKLWEPRISILCDSSFLARDRSRKRQSLL